MRIFVTLTLLIVSVISSAQTKKELKKHKEDVEASLLNKTAVVSLDTFFCSGIGYGVVRIMNADLQEYCFLNLKTGDTMIKAKLMKYGEVGEAESYFNYYFPALRSGCDVLNKDGTQDLYEPVCKFRLLNGRGLDTVKAETFVIIKGTYQKKLEAKKNNAVNFKMLDRNRTKRMKTIENDIYQDSMIIGSYEETTIIGNNGKLLRQIRVYNTQKQAVCYSTEINPANREWRIVTNMDGKYYLLKATTEKHYYDIINWLIANMYL